MIFDAIGLSLAQMQEGVNLGLFFPADYVPRQDGNGFTLDVEPAYDGHVQAITSFINEPPLLEPTVTPTRRGLADAYLSLRACYAAVPDAMGGEDEWAAIRADLLARLNTAQAALDAAGGPI